MATEVVVHSLAVYVLAIACVGEEKLFPYPLRFLYWGLHIKVTKTINGRDFPMRVGSSTTVTDS